MATAHAERRNASHGYREIECDLKNGPLADARCVLLYGNEAFLAESYEKRLRNLFAEPAAALFDIIRFDGETFSADDVIGACDTLPMMSPRRVITLAGLPGDERSLAGENAKRLAAYVPQMPRTSLLIITAGAFSKRSALYKSLQETGKIYEFGRLERADARSFIAGRFKKAGLTADGAAVDEILAVSGYLDRETEGDLYLLDGTVSMIAAYVASSGENHVGAADVRVCLGTSAESDVFMLLDAVSSGAKGRALELAHTITSKNESAFKLLSLLTSQFEIMLGCAEMRERGMSFSEMARALGVKSEYRLKKAAGFASKYSEKRLLELIHRLYRVDSDIKSGVYDENLALTMFIAEM
ncbi:MAG: DNA polymerase III subunit delta [Clostridiales Family XIII bacterium]|nr:DNA polymerase III subunit delta [Clostridiales Family XIII bacterium]